MSEPKRQPWGRQRDEDGKLEPARWFARFEIYRHLGPERTIEEAWRRWRDRESRGIKGKRPSRHWSAMSQEWRWKERAEAWDRFVARKANEELEQERLRRQKEMIQWEWDAFCQLRERIEQMLRYPLARVTRPDEEGNPTIIEPVGWRQRDILGFAKVASELGRLSVGMETSHSALDINLAAKEILDALPPGVRESVRRYLTEALQRGEAAGKGD